MAVLRSCPRWGSHGESPFSLNCFWSGFLYMALVLGFGQPVGAQPLPGLCQGELIRTNACGKSVCCLFSLWCGRKEETTGEVVSLLPCFAWRVVLGIWWGNCNIESLKGRAEGLQKLVPPCPLIPEARGEAVTWGCEDSSELGPGLLDSKHFPPCGSLQQLNRESLQAPLPPSSYLSNSWIFPNPVSSSWFLRT